MLQAFKECLKINEELEFGWKGGPGGARQDRMELVCKEGLVG